MNLPIAILTSRGQDDHSTKKDDRELLAVFEKHHEVVEYVIWNEPTRAWSEYRAVLIRSPLDYFEGNLSSFLKTLEVIETAGVPLFNSLETVRWNCKKTYLKDLAKKGISTVDTLWLTAADLPSLADLIQKRGWQECVLKPVLSAGGFCTKRFKAEPEEISRIIAECHSLEVDWMLQPFVEEITTEGEWAFIFLNEKYSHSILKKPAAGNFLVQTDHGGFLIENTPESWMIERAQQILEAVGQNTLYARIDGVRQQQNLVVMEVEMIEPELFFRFGDHFAEKFYRAFKERSKQIEQQLCRRS